MNAYRKVKCLAHCAASALYFTLYTRGQGALPHAVRGWLWREGWSETEKARAAADPIAGQR